MSQPTGPGQGQQPPPSWQQAPTPPTPPPPASWQQAPQQPVTPTAPPSAQPPSWAANLTSTAPTPGPAGFVYADVPNRAIAWIIDYVVLLVISVVIGIVVIGILGDRVADVQLQTTPSVLVASIVGFLVQAGYLIYTWTALRGTVGMKLLGMQVGHEMDGRNLDMNQAIIRVLALLGPGLVANLLSAFSLGLTTAASVVSIVWFFVLLYTTAQSPTKQGIHDKWAHSMVVKAARRAA